MVTDNLAVSVESLNQIDNKLFRSDLLAVKTSLNSERVYIDRYGLSFTRIKLHPKPIQLQKT